MNDTPQVCPRCGGLLTSKDITCPRCPAVLLDPGSVRSGRTRWLRIAVALVCVWLAADRASEHILRWIGTDEVGVAPGQLAYPTAGQFAMGAGRPRRLAVPDVDKALEEAGRHQVSIPDGVVVMPLLDDHGKTTPLGSILSLLGSYRATFVPARKLNLNFPSLENEFDEIGAFEEGQTISPTTQADILAREVTASVATGVLHLTDAGYRVDLRFQGPRGTQSFDKTVSKVDLPQVPPWIATCVHTYLGSKLTEAERTAIGEADITRAESLQKLARLETGYRLGRKDPAAWERLAWSNPHSAFVFVRYLAVVFTSRRAAHVDPPTLGLERFPGNPDVARTCGWALAQMGRRRDAARLLLGLLASEYRAPEVYGELDQALRSVQQWDDCARIYASWVRRDPGSYLALQRQGSFLIDWAWQARGDGWGNSVSPDRYRLFQDRLTEAEEKLTQAYKLNGRAVETARCMITVCRGLGRPKDVMESWFRKGIAVNPDDYYLYSAKLTYLMEKWYGSNEEMFAFARETSRVRPPGSRARLILWNAHWERCARILDARRKPRQAADLSTPPDQLDKKTFEAAMAQRAMMETEPDTAPGIKTKEEYFAQPDVWKELSALYETQLAARPGQLIRLNRYAYVASVAGHQDVANRLFQEIGDDWEPAIWSTWEDFARARDAAAEATHSGSEPSPQASPPRGG